MMLKSPGINTDCKIQTTTKKIHYTANAANMFSIKLCSIPTVNITVKAIPSDTMYVVKKYMNVCRLFSLCIFLESSL